MEHRNAHFPSWKLNIMLYRSSGYTINAIKFAMTTALRGKKRNQTDMLQLGSMRKKELRSEETSRNSEGNQFSDYAIRSKFHRILASWRWMSRLSYFENPLFRPLPNKIHNTRHMTMSVTTATASPEVPISCRDKMRSSYYVCWEWNLTFKSRLATWVSV